MSAGAPDSAAGPPLLVFRGVVNAWECDENDHLNVRFFLEKAWQGVAALAGAIDLPGAFLENATSTLAPIDTHIRFLKEGRNHDALSVYAGVIDIAESEATVYAEMRHLDGAPAATFTIRLAHVATRTGAPFPWSRRTRASLETLRCALPAHARPRSINMGRAPAGDASIARADALGAPVISLGAVRVDECDAFGRMRPDMHLGRISDGGPHGSKVQRLDSEDIGGVVLELRLATRAWPRAGDLLEIRAGIVELGEKSRREVLWILDPLSGGAWATAERVTVTFDRRARKVIALPADRAAALRETLIPDMAI